MSSFGYDVTLLEAGHFGFGSSSRNAGFLCIGPTKMSSKQLKEKFGTEETINFYQSQIDGSNYTMQLPAFDIIKAFTETKFEKGRHQKRVNMLKRINK